MSHRHDRDLTLHISFLPLLFSLLLWAILIGAATLVCLKAKGML